MTKTARKPAPAPAVDREDPELDEEIIDPLTGFMDQLRGATRGDMVRVYRRDARGEYPQCFHCPAEEFNIDQMSEELGAGKYRVQLARPDGTIITTKSYGVDENYGAGKARARPSSPPRSSAAREESGLFPPDLATARLQWELEAVKTQLAARGNGGGGGADGIRIQDIIAMMQANTNTLVQVMSQRSDGGLSVKDLIPLLTKSSPLGELAEGMSLMKQLAREEGGGGGGGGGDSSPDWVSLINTFLSRLPPSPASAVTSPRQRPPDAGERRAGERPRLVSSAPVAAAGAAGNGGGAASVISDAAQKPATAAPDDDTKRQRRLLNSVAGLIALFSESPDADAADYAAVLWDAMERAQIDMQALLVATTEDITAGLIAAMPQLKGKEAHITQLAEAIKAMAVVEEPESDAAASPERETPIGDTAP